MRFLIAAFFLLTSAPALAQPTALEAYRAGDWAYAQTRAASADGAAARVLAAEAALAPLILGEMGEAERRARRAQARTAVGYAEQALALDPDHARAHLALAAALGYEARYSNPLRAALARLPQRGRTHIERALELDPSSAYAHALMGAWHLEIVRRAGARTFGADEAVGLERYRAAARIAQTPDIPYHFALALLASDAETHEAEALDLLAAAAEMETDTAFHAAISERARSLLDLARTFRSAAAEEAARRLEQ